MEVDGRAPTEGNGVADAPVSRRSRFAMIGVIGVIAMVVVGGIVLDRTQSIESVTPAVTPTSTGLAATTPGTTEPPPAVAPSTEPDPQSSTTAANPSASSTMPTVDPTLGPPVDPPVDPTTIPTGEIPPERSDIIDAVEWGDLTWEGTPIERHCSDEFGCVQVAAGYDGSTVTYEPATRTLIRHSVPRVVATLSATTAYSSVVAVGPDEVVYMTVAGPDDDTLDIVAVAMGAGDTGQEVGRWSGIADRSGDSDLVPTRDGIVVVGCCGPDVVRPASDALVVVPWLDRSGEEIASIRPTIRVEIDRRTLVVHREDQLPAGTHSWTVELDDDWQSRGMPQAVPTFDGGFIIATDGSRGTTVTRGWINGTVRSIQVTDVVEIDLDPSGRFLVTNGDRYARVDPFPGRTWIWAGRPEVDIATGAVNLPGIDDLAEAGNDWAIDPIAFADVVAGPPAVNEQRTIDLDRRSDDTFVATVTLSNLFDDSVFAVRYELTLTREDRGWFRFETGTWSQACQPNRGHQDFDTELCR